MLRHAVGHITYFNKQDHQDTPNESSIVTPVVYRNIPKDVNLPKILYDRMHFISDNLSKF